MLWFCAYILYECKGARDSFDHISIADVSVTQSCKIFE